MDPLPNAYVFGDTQTAITLTYSLVDMMSEEELVAEVAHEFEHIACRNMLYHTLAQIVANVSELFETLITLAVFIHIEQKLRKIRSFAKGMIVDLEGVSML